MRGKSRYAREVASRLAMLLVLLMAWLPTVASADVPVFPKRPEWDDVPLPMPPEPVIVALAVVALGAVLLRARSRER